MRSKRVLSLVLVVVVMVISLPQWTITASAATFNSSYSLTGNGANDIVAVAQAQLERSQSQMGYSGNWCAAFVSDCANLAGQSTAVPYHAAVSSLYNNVIAAGGSVVSSPQKGDIAFYKSGSSFCHVSIVAGSDGTTIHGNVSWCTSTGRDNGVWHVCTRKPNVYENAMGQYHVYVRPNYKVSGPHSHSYDTFVYFLKSHPHYNCYKCSCGEIKENTSEPNYYSLCETCNPSLTFSDISYGTYYMKHNATGLYMDVRSSEDANNTNVWLYEFNGTPAQRFSIAYSSATNGGYVIKPECTSTRVVNGYGDTIESGSNVCLWDNTKHESQRWQFQKVSGGYTIHNMQNTSCAMDINGSNICLYTYNGGANQIWTLQNSVSYNANGGNGAPSMQMKNYGSSLTLSSATPTRSGYKFLGWSTSSNATSAQYSAGGSYTENANVVLYAVWEDGDTSLSLRGDVNGDANINAKDALEVLKISVGKVQPTDQQKVAADVNTDGDVNAKDALEILKYTVGKIKKFPVEDSFAPTDM